MTFSEKLSLISYEQEQAIAQNRADIIDELDTSGLFMDALLERKVVTPEIYKRHDAATTDTCRNRLVLDFLMKGSQKHLDEFIKILEEQGQSHIVPLFLVQGNAKNYLF